MSVLGGRTDGMKLESILTTALSATTAVLDNIGVALEYRKLADKRRDGARRACKRLRARLLELESQVSKMRGAQAEADAARQQRDDYLMVLNTIARGNEAQELLKIRQILGEFSRGVSVIDGVRRLIDIHNSVSQSDKDQQEKNETE